MLPKEQSVSLSKVVAVTFSASVAAFSQSPATPTAAPAPSAHYIGSLACKTCHPEIYDRWKATRMANVVRDPKEHPDAILPDLSKPDPLVTFTKDDIAFRSEEHTSELQSR